jgi:hypothetical protein
MQQRTAAKFKAILGKIPQIVCLHLLVLTLSFLRNNPERTVL